jgi:hypothetical protein
MAKYKGEGSLCNCMGQTIAEFIDGELVTDDPNVIAFMAGKGYVAESEATVPIRSKPVVTNRE